jgi:hypothetical protein
MFCHFLIAPIEKIVGVVLPNKLSKPAAYYQRRTRGFKKILSTAAPTVHAPICVSL